jgi:Rrf2 family transcriptional regulator, cysteine metabolism repressor
MVVSQKCQYALRAVFELAKHKVQGGGPLKIADVAEAQAIPGRFLEVILGQLKQSGIVDSQRGSKGGYYLVGNPEQLTVGEVIRFVEGPIGPVSCVSGKPKDMACPLYQDCVFYPMWEKAREAISEIYDGTTFQDLVEQERQRAHEYVPCYVI